MALFKKFRARRAYRKYLEHPEESRFKNLVKAIKRLNEKNQTEFISEVDPDDHSNLLQHAVRYGPDSLEEVLDMMSKLSLDAQIKIYKNKTTRRNMNALQIAASRCYFSTERLIEKISQLPQEVQIEIFLNQSQKGWNVVHFAVLEHVVEPLWDTILRFPQEAQIKIMSDPTDEEGLNVLQVAACRSINSPMVPVLDLIQTFPQTNQVAILSNIARTEFYGYANALLLVVSSLGEHIYPLEVLAPMLAAIKNLPQAQQMGILLNMWRDNGNVLHCAARYGHSPGIAHELLDYISTMPQDVQRKLFLYRMNGNWNPLQVAIRYAPILIERFLAEISSLSQETKTKILCNTVEDGLSILQIAVEYRRSLKVIEQLLEAIKILPSEFQIAILLNKTNKAPRWDVFEMAEHTKGIDPKIKLALQKRLGELQSGEEPVRVFEAQRNTSNASLRFFDLEQVQPLVAKDLAPAGNRSHFAAAIPK